MAIETCRAWHSFLYRVIDSAVGSGEVTPGSRPLTRPLNRWGQAAVSFHGRRFTLYRVPVKRHRGEPGHTSRYSCVPCRVCVPVPPVSFYRYGSGSKTPGGAGICHCVISNHGTRSHRRTSQPTRPTIHVALAGLHLTSTPLRPLRRPDRRTPDPEPTEREPQPARRGRLTLSMMIKPTWNDSGQHVPSSMDSSYGCKALS